MKTGSCILIILICLAGCGDPPSPAASAADLAARLGATLPDGWKAGRAGDAGVPLPDGTAADDVLVWRPGPVALQRRPGEAAAGQGVLCFPLLVRPWIDPADFPARRRSWQDAAQARAAADAAIAQIPRSIAGEPMPRSELEIRAVAAWRAAVAALPPVEALPTHHSGRIGVLPVDHRSRQVPDDRDLQREQNLVFGRIGQALTRYPEAP